MTGLTVAIGVTLFNRAPYLPEALESLLSQTYRPFVLILCDDCSTDATPQIVRRYAALDERIIYYRNQKRLGMIRNWRRAFELARTLYPEIKYFAWASDHDVWHPRWLAALVAAMDRHPEVVLAYPLNLRISETGEVLHGPWTFETLGMVSTWKRFSRTCHGMSAGNMIYGLFRSCALAQAGVFRSVLIPDRLLLAELSLYGQFEQVPEVLWYRRFAGQVTLDRQRTAFFPEGSPSYTRLPWWILHTIILLWNLGARGTGRPYIGRLLGFALSLRYAQLSGALAGRRSWRRLFQRVGLLDRSLVGAARKLGGKVIRRSLPRWLSAHVPPLRHVARAKE